MKSNDLIYESFKLIPWTNWTLQNRSVRSRWISSSLFISASIKNFEILSKNLIKLEIIYYHLQIWTPAKQELTCLLFKMQSEIAQPLPALKQRLPMKGWYEMHRIECRIIIYSNFVDSIHFFSFLFLTVSWSWIGLPFSSDNQWHTEQRDINPPIPKPHLTNNSPLGLERTGYKLPSLTDEETI